MKKMFDAKRSFRVITAVILVACVLFSFNIQTLALNEEVSTNSDCNHFDDCDGTDDVSILLKEDGKSDGSAISLETTDVYVSYLSSKHTHKWSKWRYDTDIHWKFCEKGCGKYKSVEEHTLYEYKRVNATCTKNGYVKYKCKCGYTYKKTLKSSNAHKYGSWKVTVQPTCCKKGSKQRTCIYCGKVSKKSIAPTDDHNFDWGTMVTAPTCSRNGIKEYTCRNCGNWYQVEIPATGSHVYGSYYVYRNATCYQQGINARNCMNCNHVDYQYVDKVGHTFDNGVITVQPTCTNNGTIVYTCRICGGTKSEYLSSNDSHTAEYWQCDENGHWLDCDKCHTRYMAGSHSFDGGQMMTGQYAGIIAYTCSTCGYKWYKY